MTIPMMILSIGSAFGGMLLLFVANIESWLEPVVGFEHAHGGPDSSVLIPVTLTIVAIGAMMGWVQYAKREVPAVAPTDVSIFTKAARADLYGDTFNEAVFMRPGQYLTRSLVFVDNKVVDGVVNGTAGLVGVVAAQLRRTQTGFVRSYALVMVLGVVVIGAIAAIVGMA
jgi:NADH-quinone oxidoreductase subunit L